MARVAKKLQTMSQRSYNEDIYNVDGTTCDQKSGVWLQPTLCLLSTAFYCLLLRPRLALYSSNMPNKDSIDDTSSIASSANVDADVDVGAGHGVDREFEWAALCVKFCCRFF